MVLMESVFPVSFQKGQSAVRPSVRPSISPSVSHWSVVKNGIKDTYIYLKRMYSVIYSKQRKWLKKGIFNKFKFTD